MSSPTIALCLEYPLGLRGGVSVLVGELIRGFATDFRIVLVSPDETAPPPVAVHVRWEPGKVSRDTSVALAVKLRELGVSLAHFHIGGVYGWGIRIPGQSPLAFAARAGIAVCSTAHLAVTLLDGYCGPEKPLWFKLAVLPLAWFGKLHALSHVRAEIAVSRHDEACLRRWFWPFASRFRHIYHSRLAPENLPPAPESRAPVVLAVGHMAFRKGQHVLARAFAKVAAEFPAWQLQLAGVSGEPDCEAEIRALAARAGLEDRIHLLGERADALTLMRQAAIYVQPSFFEGLPLALQEAMLCGCACIGSDISGNDELITHDDTGMLVPPGDVARLASALARLMADAEARAKLGARASAAIVSRGMTAAAMLDAHRRLYAEMLVESVAPRSISG